MAAKTRLPSETVDGLIKALLVLSRTVDQVLDTQAVKTAVGESLSSSKVQILRLLGQRGRQTSTQVARYLGVTKPAVSQIIDSMVTSKLVVRKPAVHDRREVGLELTKRGRSQFQGVRREQRHVMRNSLRLSNSITAKKWIDAFQGFARDLAQADHTFEEYCLQCGAFEDDTCVLVGGNAECLFLQHSKGAQGRSAATTRKTPQGRAASTTRAKRKVAAR